MNLSFNEYNIGTMTTTNTTGQAKRQKTDDDSSTTAEDDRNNVSPPTGKQLSLALCRIDDTDMYSTDDINKALDNLGTWAGCNDNQDEIARISKDFIELGGIPRILNFIQDNKDNVGFMLRASKIIEGFLDPGSNDEHLENASTMAQKFVEREGVEMMLSIIKEKYTGELDVDQLTTLENIFDVFCHTIPNMNAKNMVDIDKFSHVIDAGISTMAILSNINTHDAAVAHLKESIFIYFQNFVSFNADMMDIVDFQEKNIFPKCVRALKDPVDNSWKYDKKAWGYASSFFYECCMENREILSRKNDFKVIIPFCIRFMKEDPDHSSSSGVVDLLREASDIIGKKKMITSNKGLLEVLGTIVYCGNDTVSNDVKEKAMNLMEHFFGES